MPKRKEELIPFLVKLSPIDKHIMDEMSSSMGLYSSDIIRLALWNYVNVPKEGVLKVTLKELARSRELSFKMDILKELERSNNRQIFYIDGFKTMISTYHSKYAPLDGVRRFVTIKLIAIYSLFNSIGQRKNYMDYIKKHYLHYYPNEKKWITKQINIVRSLKKHEKDKLLLKLQKEITNDKGNVHQLPEVVGIVSGELVPEVPAKRGKAADTERES